MKAVKMCGDCNYMTEWKIKVCPMCKSEHLFPVFLQKQGELTTQKAMQEAMEQEK